MRDPCRFAMNEDGDGAERGEMKEFLGFFVDGCQLSVVGGDECRADGSSG